MCKICTLKHHIYRGADVQNVLSTAELGTVRCVLKWIYLLERCQSQYMSAVSHTLKISRIMCTFLTGTFTTLKTLSFCMILFWQEHNCVDSRLLQLKYSQFFIFVSINFLLCQLQFANQNSWWNQMCTFWFYFVITENLVVCLLSVIWLVFIHIYQPPTFHDRHKQIWLVISMWCLSSSHKA